VLFALWAGACASATSGGGVDGGADGGVDGGIDGGADGGAGGDLSVLAHHNGPRRDGLYVDPTLTKASAAGFHRDASFDASAISGAIYAQPLFFEGGPSGKDVVIAATEQNLVYALDAASGAVVWQRSLGTPVPLANLPCGNIDPMGVTGTPVIDPASRTLYLDAMTTPDSGTTKKHLVFALSLDDGSDLPGWPVDVGAAASFAGNTFDSSVQGQRGALALLGGTLYVPFGGHAGDCGSYRGWLVGLSVGSPGSVQAWATGAVGGGAWGVSGVASDGASLFLATGNTFGAVSWEGGEALLRFAAGPVFSGSPADYFAASDWQALDAGDVDLGGTGPVLVDVPGSTPSKLLVGLGKDGKIYLVDRASLGGIGGAMAVVGVASGAIINAAAAYATAQGTYVVFRGAGSSCPSGQGGDLTSVRIVPGSPPTVATAWCARQNGAGSPVVTTTDGHAEAIVWSVGAEGDARLHGFDGDTGQVVYAGGGSADAMPGGVRRFQTPILAKGRFFVGGNGAVHAFTR
jgi:hypothetical protein